MSSISVNTITDASGGSTTSINGFTPSVSNMAGRNRIINGDMRIDQRNAGASVTPTANPTYLVDRWFFGLQQASKMSFQQSSTAPAGFNNSLLATSLSAYTPLSSDYHYLGQRVEGYNVADLGWGTADAKTITLSFWVRSSVTGTLSGSLSNSGATRSYPFTYTISSANTWEQKFVTIAGDTAGTWDKTNGRGIVISFSLGSGSTYLGTADAWAGAYYTGATGSIQPIATSGATFYITGVQLEEGSVATPFCPAGGGSYGAELALCQRYYWQVSGVSGSTTGCTIDGLYSSGSGAGIFYSFMHPVTMRTAPTATVNYNDLTNASSVVVTTSIYGANVSANGGTTSSGRTGFTFNSTGFVKMSAEL